MHWQSHIVSQGTDCHRKVWVKMRSLFCILLQSYHCVYCSHCVYCLQETSSSGGCLGTQPVTLTSMHQAMTFFKGQYFVETTNSQAINLLFAALFDLIFCHTTKMGLFVPAPAEGCTLNAVLAKKIPKIQDEEDEKWLVGADILAYLKRLITTAAFQGPKC